MEMLYSRDPSPADEPACFIGESGCGIGEENGARWGACSESEKPGPSCAVPKGAEWERFQRSLSASGYFRGELEVYI